MVYRAVSMGWVLHWDCLYFNSFKISKHKNVTTNILCRWYAKSATPNVIGVAHIHMFQYTLTSLIAYSTFNHTIKQVKHIIYRQYSQIYTTLSFS